MPSGFPMRFSRFCEISPIGERLFFVANAGLTRGPDNRVLDRGNCPAARTL
jgi:hypothetical protein